MWWHNQSRGSGGMLPWENYDLSDYFWWLLRPHTQTKRRGFFLMNITSIIIVVGVGGYPWFLPLKLIVNVVMNCIEMLCRVLRS